MTRQQGSRQNLVHEEHLRLPLQGETGRQRRPTKSSASYQTNLRCFSLWLMATNTTEATQSRKEVDEQDPQATVRGCRTLYHYIPLLNGLPTSHRRQRNPPVGQHPVSSTSPPAGPMVPVPWHSYRKAWQ
jgi:hypothetical protein